MIELEITGAEQAVRADRAAQSVGAIRSSGSHHALSVASRSVDRRVPARLQLVEPRLPVGLVVAQVRAPCRRRSPSTSASGIGWVTVMLVGRDLDLGARDRQHAAMAGRRRVGRGTTRWSGKIDSSSPSITLRWNRSSSRNAGGPALGTTARASIALDVPHRPRELAARPWHRTSRRISSSGMSYTIGYQIAPEYCSQCRSTGPCDRSASRSVVRQSFWLTSRVAPSTDHHRRVAAGTVGDRDLGVDRDREPGGDLESPRRRRCG